MHNPKQSGIGVEKKIESQRDRERKRETKSPESPVKQPY